MERPLRYACMHEGRFTTEARKWPGPDDWTATVELRELTIHPERCSGGIALVYDAAIWIAESLLFAATGGNVQELSALDGHEDAKQLVAAVRKHLNSFGRADFDELARLLANYIVAKLQYGFVDIIKQAAGEMRLHVRTMPDYRDGAFVIQLHGWAYKLPLSMTTALAVTENET